MNPDIRSQALAAANSRGALTADQVVQHVTAFEKYLTGESDIRPEPPTDDDLLTAIVDTASVLAVAVLRADRATDKVLKAQEEAHAFNLSLADAQMAHKAAVKAHVEHCKAQLPGSDQRPIDPLISL